jgi:catechol 2,3-dioxygenase-like lactoylglutathione lyase family enzyme
MIDTQRLLAASFLSFAMRAVMTAGIALAAPAFANSTMEKPRSVQLGGHAFQQVAVTTKDLPRAIAFYRDVLGLSLLFESNNMAFFDVDGVRLMIGLDANRPDTRPTSVLYFDAPQFLATRSKLEALGVPFEGGIETVDRKPDAELKLQQFTDPDGNALAVMGWVRGK